MTNHDNWVTALVDEMMEDYNEKEEGKLAELNLIIDLIEDINKDIVRLTLISTTLNPYRDTERLSEVYNNISILKGMIVAQEKEMERINRR